jgi:hypothetical protein
MRVFIGRQANPVDTQATAFLSFLTAYSRVRVHAGLFPIRGWGRPLQLRSAISRSETHPRTMVATQLTIRCREPRRHQKSDVCASHIIACKDPGKAADLKQQVRGTYFNLIEQSLHRSADGGVDLRLPVAKQGKVAAGGENLVAGKVVGNNFLFCTTGLHRNLAAG